MLITFAQKSFPEGAVVASYTKGYSIYSYIYILLCIYATLTKDLAVNVRRC